MAKNGLPEDSLFFDLKDESYEKFMVEDEVRLNKTALNSAEKARIYNTVICNIANAKQEPKNKKRRHSPLFYTRAVPLLMICILLLGTTAATAAGSLKINEKLAEFLNVSAEQQEVAVMPVRTEKAADSSEHLEITQAQAVGDGKNIYVTFEMRVPPGVCLDNACFFNATDIMIDGDEYGSWTCTYDFLDCEKDRATVIINIAFDEDVSGKKITITNTDICRYKAADSAAAENAAVEKKEEDPETETLLSGSWTVSCRIEKEQSREKGEYSVNLPVTVGGSEYVWEKMILTPLSATLYLNCDGNTDMSEVYNNFTITMIDGSVLTQDDFYMMMGNTRQIDISFGKVLDLSQIKSVSLSGCVYELNQESPEQEK
ncbi:MAG: hypothetical protein ACOX7J_01600 [Bacillota bacterium]